MEGLVDQTGALDLGAKKDGKALAGANQGGDGEWEVARDFYED